MNCCHCGRKLDVSRNSIPPVWYGQYRASELIKVVCSDCIKTPAGRDKYEKENEDGGRR